jgi:hypothetical protein
MERVTMDGWMGFIAGRNMMFDSCENLNSSTCSMQNAHGRNKEKERYPVPNSLPLAIGDKEWAGIQFCFVDMEVSLHANNR